MSLQLSITTDYFDENGPIVPRLEQFAAAGFTHVHWCEHWATRVLYEEFYVAGVGQALKAAGLKLLDTHNCEVPGASPSSLHEKERHEGVRLLQNRLHFTAALGGDCVVVHPAPFAETDPGVQTLRWQALERSITEVAPLCEQTGVKLALENMAKPRPPHFEALLNRFPKKILGFCLDSGHANIAGQPELPEVYADRLCALHLHDNKGLSDEHALPGCGTIDWPRLARALAQAGYNKPLNYEVVWRNTPLSTEQFVREAYRLGREFSELLHCTSV